MGMTIKAKQYDLYYLGYYGTSLKDIDGIWGKRSIKGTKQFQEDANIPVTGNFDALTESKMLTVMKTIQRKLGCGADGIAGPITMNATKKYQMNNGLDATGLSDSEFLSKIDIDIREVCEGKINNPTTVVTPSTPENSFWDHIKYFKRNEFKCKCGGKYCNGFPHEPEQKLIESADTLREILGVPINVSSGLRCTKHNANVGGVYNSRHLTGKAMDFCAKGKSANYVLSVIKSRLPNIRYCYAINSSYVHMDIY